MTKNVTGAARLRDVVAAGVVPESAQVDSRRRRCSWQERGMGMELVLEPFRPGHPTETGRWTLFVSPRGVLGRARERGGADTVIAVRPGLEADPSWSSWVAGAGFYGLVREGRDFVADEADMCWLLTQRTEVARGDLMTWHYQSFAARVVKSLLLARQSHDRQAEQRALQILHGGESVPVSPTAREGILAVARRRAEEISRDTGLEITLGPASP